MLHHPYDAFDKFEEISHLVKQTHLKIKDPKFDHEVNAIQHEQANPQKEAYIQKCRNLLREVSYLLSYLSLDHRLATQGGARSAY